MLTNFIRLESPDHRLSLLSASTRYIFLPQKSQLKGLSKKVEGGKQKKLQKLWEEQSLPSSNLLVF